VNDKVLFEAQGRSGRQKAVDLEDIKFHQCVRLASFERDRTISFIPPDGAFDLMCGPRHWWLPLGWQSCCIVVPCCLAVSAPAAGYGYLCCRTYRLSQNIKPLIWVECQVDKHSRSRTEYLVKARSQFKERSTATSVEILLPLPPDAISPTVRTSQVSTLPFCDSFCKHTACFVMVFVSTLFVIVSSGCMHKWNLYASGPMEIDGIGLR
jgi:AP-1 complex subunit mu